MDGVDYVPLAPFCNALGIQIAEENGGFSDIAELMRVSGIGEKTFAEIQDEITVGE